jgi:hypothetical protein
MYVFCVYPAMSKKSKNLSDLSKKDRNKRHSSSDSGNSSNNENLIQLFKEASKLDSSHKLFIGDFNYPCINWETWSCTNDSTTTPEFRFIECIRDCFLTQHVTNV